MKYITTIYDQVFQIEILDEHHVSINGKTYDMDFNSVSGQEADPSRGLCIQARTPGKCS